MSFSTNNQIKTVPYIIYKNPNSLIFQIRGKCGKEWKRITTNNWHKEEEIPEKDSNFPSILWIRDRFFASDALHSFIYESVPPRGWR